MALTTKAVIVCGSRDWTDRQRIEDELARLERETPPTTQLIIVEGGAKGADRIAGQWAAKARARGIGWVRVPAKWDEHDFVFCPGQWCALERSSCLGAGPYRNQQMLDYALQADERSVLAFKDGFDRSMKKGGTEDMIKRAKAAGLHGKIVGRRAP